MIKLKQNFVYDDFVTMFELEKQYYSVEHITPPAESFEWYKHRKNSLIAVEDEGEIIGFMCLFPISKQIKQSILQGTFNDATLTYDDILDEKHLNVSEEATLFLSCVVIHKQYRKTEALKLLLNEYKNYYLNLNDRGYVFDMVLSDNVTDDGLAFSKRLGLMPFCNSDHGSVIVKGHYQTFIDSILA